MRRQSTAAALQMSAPAQSKELETYQAEGLCCASLAHIFPKHSQEPGNRMNAVHTKELLLTSHLQSPPGHRQDPFNKPGSETPIVQNLQLATGYHHSLWLCKIKDLEEG
ncbi:uncharacterized protein LOC116561583 [Sapajus apella]|uniref:Uncharacterized protein LOC116561583 n=1 Tax=Sapajus apella TaxID=9515 RepID=A0A6J3J3E9_SAPAP|nr:uncharacterized protein LOC116561583 [Sapajus apella]